jgi:WD40 repeat protein
MKKPPPIDKRQRSISQFFGAKTKTEIQNDDLKNNGPLEDNQTVGAVPNQPDENNIEYGTAEHANPSLNAIVSPRITATNAKVSTTPTQPHLEKDKTRIASPALPKTNTFDAFAFKSSTAPHPLPIFPQRAEKPAHRPAPFSGKKKAVTSSVPPPTASPLPVSPLPTPLLEQPNAYELERLERIRRNMEVMKNLGLGAGGSATLNMIGTSNTIQGGGKPVRRCGSGGSHQRKRPRSLEEREALPTGPVRRSQRNVRGVEDGYGNGSGSGGTTAMATEEAVNKQKEEEHLTYDDSSVHRYVCKVMAVSRQDIPRPATNTVLLPPPPPPPPSSSDAFTNDASIQGFQRLSRMLVDSALARAYSLDYYEPSGLVVAAGKDGRMALWGTHAMPIAQTNEEERDTLGKKEVDNKENIDQAEEDDDDDDEVEVEPLLSCKLHKGWISDVQLWQNTPGSSGCSEDESHMFLLSSGNDGVVCLWDVTKTATTASELPQCLVRSEDIHDAGVYSMHCAGTHRVLTGSKDCSVVISTFDTLGLNPNTKKGSTLSSTFSVVQRYDNLHDGCVVKCVRWKPSISTMCTNGTNDGDAVVFASCGNDRAIRIVDTRIEGNSGPTGGGGLVLEGVHSTTINHIRWSPASEHVFLSASHDPAILLHDLRKPETALFSYIGHSPPGKRINSIYQPVFVAGGTAIASAGSDTFAHQLSLYSVLDGKTISRGDVDINIGATYCGRGGGGNSAQGTPLFCSSTRCVAMFAPQWKK